MRKIVIAPDSFKESMTALQAAQAMQRGVQRVLPDAECTLVPMADGGEGTTGAIVDALGGQLVEVPTTDALGRPVLGTIGFMEKESTVVLEVASAAGIDLIAPKERDVEIATSRGVADLITAAFETGAERLIVGLGGSVTNDGGAGMLTGLGARLLDADGNELPPQPRALKHLDRIDLSELDPRLSRVQIDLACDVTNPLLCSEGASAVFGPQKGASPEQIPRLDHDLEVYAEALERAIGHRVRDHKGAGAAGGIGFAPLALGAQRREGVGLVAEAVSLRAQIDGADLVLTGEGAIDAQTLSGKTPAGVARLARAADIPVIAFAGRVDPSADALLKHGIIAVVPILQGVSDLSTALTEAPENLERSVATCMRLLVAREAWGNWRPA
jgi:glycerate 2-kinase